MHQNPCTSKTPGDLTYLYFLGMRAQPTLFLFGRRVILASHHSRTREDISDMKWDAAVANIKAVPQSPRIESMVELLLSKILSESNYQALLEQYVPEIAAINGLPTGMTDNLQLLSKLVRRDLDGSSTFATLLGSLEVAKKEPVVRVLFVDGCANGAKLVADIEKANGELQGRFEQVCQLEEVSRNMQTADKLDDVCKLVALAADLELAQEDLESENVSKDFQAVANVFSKWLAKVRGDCNLEKILVCLEDGKPLVLGEVDAFFQSNRYTVLEGLVRVVENPKVLSLLEKGDSGGQQCAESLNNLHKTAPWPQEMMSFFHGSITTTFSVGFRGFQESTVGMCVYTIPWHMQSCLANFFHSSYTRCFGHVPQDACIGPMQGCFSKLVQVTNRLPTL